MRGGRRSGKVNQRFLHGAVPIGIAPVGEVLDIHCGDSEPDLLSWTFWPDREDLSVELLKLISAAQS
jgi:hypothetical protein